jgi:hypothetical protein
MKRTLFEDDALTISSDARHGRVPRYPLHPLAADVALPQRAGALKLHADNKAHSQG